jgi:hypothetical protein
LSLSHVKVGLVRLRGSDIIIPNSMRKTPSRRHNAHARPSVRVSLNPFELFMAPFRPRLLAYAQSNEIDFGILRVNTLPP